MEACVSSCVYVLSVGQWAFHAAQHQVHTPQLETHVATILHDL